MELFAVVADMLGEGLPLSYLFITTEENAAPLTKQNTLIVWMNSIRSLGIDPRFTLSDKDQSEINALKEVWPDAKHQLCLWHILRALKRRLSQNENPISYHALEAHHAFPDIDPAFVPLRQMSTKEKVRTDGLLYRADSRYYITLILVVQGTVSPPPERPLARIRLCVNGKQAVFTPNLRITLKIPIVDGRATPAAGNSAGTDVVMEGGDDHSSDGEDGLARCARKQAAGMLNEYEDDAQRLPGDGRYGSEEDEGEEDEGEEDEGELEFDIIHAAERLALEVDDPASDPEDDSEDDDACSDSSDSSDSGDERDPDFIPKLKLHGTKLKVPEATGGMKRTPNRKRNPNYVFCPLSHRLSILCLVSKHFCQHPILLERHGQTRKPWQIHWDAVLEAYYHCKANNLREVWAYLWTNWYAHGKWELWARSSYEHAIPRKRTTMLVEALWRNFKRMVLYHYNRPRVDLATYALVTQGIPPYRVHFNRIIRDPRDGRAKCLRGEQIPIKHAWLALRMRPTSGSFEPDVQYWLCPCGQQKYHSYLLCKHLVKALPIPSADWWANVIRRHTAPFYDIRELLPEHLRETAPSPAALGPRYWTGQVSAPSQRSSRLTASQFLVSGTHVPI